MLAALPSAVLMVSHDLSAVVRLCTEVMVMHDGRIIETGSAQGILTEPQHEHTRDLIDAIPRLA